MPAWNETFYPVPASGKDAPLQLLLAGITHKDTTYRICRKGGENLYVLEYVLSGKGHIRFGQDRFTPRGGDVYLIQPHEENEYYSDKEDPWEKIWFNLAGPLPEALIKAYSLHGIIHFPKCPLKKEFFAALELIRKGGEEFAREFPLAIHRIFLGLHFWHLQHPLQEYDPRILPVKEYLDKHWQEKIDMGLLSTLSGLSCAQLIRLFRRYYKETPCQYLQKLRISYGCQFLENTPYSVKSLSALLGFKDEFYFSNCFKQHTGLSPSAYRKRKKG